MNVLMVPKALSLLADALGAVGAALLYKGSFAYEAPAFYFDAQGKMLEAMKKRNERRQVMQRAGFCLILVSFILQAVSTISGQP